MGLIGCVGSTTAGQDIEPRRWNPLPVGTNIVSTTYVYTTGDIDFDPSLRIEDADVESHALLLTYNRYFDLAGKTARFDVRLPIKTTRWDGLLDGSPASTSRDGLADPRFRLSVNLVGAPALAPPEFLDYQTSHPVNTSIGAGLAVSLPLGQYDDDKLLNLGSNRVTFKPQLGVLHRRGPWSFELTGSLSLFTENDDFFGGNSLEQDPLYELQAHVVRTFRRGYTVSAGAAYAWAGETSINGVGTGDPASDLFYGVTFGFPVARTQAIQLAYVGGVTLADTGADTHSFLVSWSIRF